MNKLGVNPARARHKERDTRIPGIAGYAQSGKRQKEPKFATLLHHLTVRLLRDSFCALKRKAAAGVDGLTWQEYETGLEDRLIGLHSRFTAALLSRRGHIRELTGDGAR
jgi:hypothetical protein